jgi:hypothetical protein
MVRHRCVEPRGEQRLNRAASRISRSLINSSHADASGKKSSQSFLRKDPVSRRRTRDADRQLIFVGSMTALAGAAPRRISNVQGDGRQFDVFLPPRLSADSRWIVDPAPLLGNEFSRPAHDRSINPPREMRTNQAARADCQRAGYLATQPRIIIRWRGASRHLCEAAPSAPKIFSL